MQLNGINKSILFMALLIGCSNKASNETATDVLTKDQPAVGRFVSEKEITEAEADLGIDPNCLSGPYIDKFDASVRVADEWTYWILESARNMKPYRLIVRNVVDDKTPDSQSFISQNDRLFADGVRQTSITKWSQKVDPLNKEKIKSDVIYLHKSENFTESMTLEQCTISKPTSQTNKYWKGHYEYPNGSKVRAIKSETFKKGKVECVIYNPPAKPKSYTEEGSEHQVFISGDDKFILATTCTSRSKLNLYYFREVRNAQNTVINFKKQIATGPIRSF